MSNLEFKTWSFNLLSDENVDQYVFVVDEVLKLDLPDDCIVYKCKAGEELKTFQKLEKALNYFLDNGVTRKSHLVAIGGGSVSDFAGLIASLLLRGINWSVVPTTLLSMVDASIGGKTAVNAKQGKNLIGTFHFPKSILIDEAFLKTLDQKEIESGRGEVLKYAFLDKNIFNCLSRENYSWSDIIRLCALYKTKIVEKDLYEGGERKLLNLGHTFGHAIEKDSGIHHGIAVVYGLEVILKLYGTESILNKMQQLKKNLELSHLDLNNIKIDSDSILGYLKSDKKNVGKGYIELVIPQDIGDVSIVKKAVHDIENDFQSMLST